MRPIIRIIPTTILFVTRFVIKHRAVIWRYGVYLFTIYRQSRNALPKPADKRMLNR